MAETNELKATPGPWKVRAATFCDDGIPSYEVVMPGDPQMNACDARLIAAAPDLLAALRQIVDEDSSCGCQHDTNNCCATVGEFCPSCIAHTAIAKAEGRD